MSREGGREKRWHDAHNYVRRTAASVTPLRASAMAMSRTASTMTRCRCCCRRRRQDEGRRKGRGRDLVVKRWVRTREWELTWRRHRRHVDIRTRGGRVGPCRRIVVRARARARCRHGEGEGGGEGTSLSERRRGRGQLEGRVVVVRERGRRGRGRGRVVVVESSLLSVVEDMLSSPHRRRRRGRGKGGSPAIYHKWTPLEGYGSTHV